jgi:hypothetical protein
MRFLQRHLHATLAAFFTEQLTDLGWVTEPTNFGEPPLNMVTTDRTTRLEAIEPNALALTIDQQGRDALAQLGGGAYETEVLVLADVYGTSPSVAVSIASDIKDLVRDRYLPIADMTASTPVQTGVVAELEDAVMTRPDGDVNAVEFKGAWRIVRFYARVHFPG